MVKKINVNSLYRVGIVVKNIEKTTDTICKYFNIDESKIYKIDTSNKPTPNTTFYGKPTQFTIKLCIIPLANIELELIQPLDNNGPYSEFFNQHGEGIHHFNIDVDDNNAFYDMMTELNATFLTSGKSSDGTISYKYYDSRDSLGMILELCEKIS